MKEAIESKDLSSYEEEYKKDKSHKVIERTVTHNGLYNSAIDKETFDSLTDTFSVDVKAGSVTNQKQSGRCWMFAGLNVLRTILMKKLNIKNIELSQAYLQFYDKLEKSNATLERAMLLLDEPVDSRMNTWNLDNRTIPEPAGIKLVNLFYQFCCMRRAVTCWLKAGILFGFVASEHQ